MGEVESKTGKRRSQVLAWGVHLYTGLGLVAAAGIAVLIVRGGADAFRWAFVLMLVAVLIDATDGTLARWARVKEVLPGFDGRRLDDLTDFLTYTFLPLFLLWRAEVISDGLSWCLVVALLASAYGYCQVSAKTDDGFFLGFPSYWNLVAFYLYVLRPPAWFSVGAVLVLAFLTFVPSRYLYPSQRGRLNLLTNILAGLWAVLLVWILWRLPPSSANQMADDSTRQLALISLLFPLYYMVLSWTITLKFWRMGRRAG